MRLKWTVFLVVLCGAVGQAAPASAHKLFVFATVRGQRIEGEVYYHGGDPAKDIKVAVVAPDGTTWAEVSTGEDGGFVYQARFRADHRLVADAGFGHRVEYTVPAGELPAELPVFEASPENATGQPLAGDDSQSADPSSHAHDHGDPAATIEALTQQIVAMRRDLDRWKARLRLQDLLGGIGYILGIMGLASYLMRNRGR